MGSEDLYEWITIWVGNSKQIVDWNLGTKKPAPFVICLENLVQTLAINCK